MSSIFVVVPADPNMVLKLSGAYHEEHKIITPDETIDDGNLKKTMRFYVNRDLETDIGVKVR